MDDADRAELRAADTDDTAMGFVALHGVIGICAQLLASDTLAAREVGKIREFMLASIERSGATGRRQENLRQSIDHQFSALFAATEQLVRKTEAGGPT